MTLRRHVRSFLMLPFAALAGLMPAAAQDRPRIEVPAVPVHVLLVGMFHFDNPGADYRNLAVDDVLKPGRQREIAALADRLATFRPIRIGVEWSEAAVARAYPQYLAGTLPPARDEVVQLAFRIARTSGLKSVDGLDVPVSLPFGDAMKMAGANGQQPLIDRITRYSDAMAAAQERALKSGGIAATLRLLNDPAYDNGHHLYRALLAVGKGEAQPGVEVSVAWYRRNLATCAKLIQAAKPGDRVIVFYGAGHLPLLRQCVTETPGYVLEDAMSYLGAATTGPATPPSTTSPAAPR